MTETIIVGDLHLRKEEPFLSCAKLILDNILDITASDDNVIFLGDFFHTSRPYPEELRIALNFFEDFKGSIYILAGNHEYLETRDSFAEDAFKDSKVQFIDTPQEIEIDGKNFLFLPWMSSFRFRKLGFSTLKDYYENWLENWNPKNPNEPLYVLYHFEDETTFMGLDEVGIDLSMINKKMKGKVIRIGGHIHVASENYLGTPYVTRKDESGKTSSIIHMEGTSMRKEPLRTLIEYKDVDYEDLDILELDPNISYLLTVHGAPSVESVFEWKKNRPNVFIEDYELMFGDNREILEEKTQMGSIKEYLEAFIKQNKVDRNTANYLLSIF